MNNIFANADFLKMSMRRDVDCQKKMTTAESESLERSHRKLVTDIPDNFRNPHSDKTAISDMLRAHQ